MTFEEARELLKETMESKFKDKTFRHYINESLAGDFAAEIATVVKEMTADLAAAQSLRAAAEGEVERWVCPQCFTSIREGVVTYKEKPKHNCPDHWRLEYVRATIPTKEPK